VAVDTLVEANVQRGRVDEGNPGAVTQAAGSQIHEQRHERRRDVLDKTRVADQTGKFRAPGFQDLIHIVGFEVPVMGLMKGNQNGHNLADRQGTSSLALPLAAGKQLSVPERQKCLAKIIDIAEQLE